MPFGSGAFSAGPTTAHFALFCWSENRTGRRQSIRSLYSASVRIGHKPMHWRPMQACTKSSIGSGKRFSSGIGHRSSSEMKNVVIRSPEIAGAVLSAAAILGVCQLFAQGRDPSIGREIAVARHLADGQELTTPLTELLVHGKLLFEANWTDQEGGRRPLTKGTGRPLSDPSRPLTGVRAFNRITAPDANSCAGCHNAPYRISGGGGDVVTNVFVLAQRFDFVTFDRADTLPTRGAVDEAGKPVSLLEAANQRATTAMFGAGYL